MGVRSLRAAFLFLTRLPVGGYPYTPDEQRGSSGYFPLVGAVVGLWTAFVFRALAPAGDLAAALLAVGASTLLTGAFHEDGFADTSDALGGGYDRERVLQILKDSRIGTFGAVAVVVSVVGRALLIARLGTHAWWALPLVGGVARVGPVWMMRLLPYATSDAASRSRHVARAGGAQLMLATTWAALGLGGAGMVMQAPGRMGAIALATAAVTALSGWRYYRRLSGVTGDFLGATEQLCELAGLVVCVWGRS